MSENATAVARIAEHNTGGQNRETIAREHIGMIANHHSQFDGGLDDAIVEAVDEGFIVKQDDEYRVTGEVWKFVPDTNR